MKFIIFTVLFFSLSLAAQEKDMERMDAKESALYLFKNLHEANYEILWKSISPSFKKKIIFALNKANKAIPEDVRDRFLKTAAHASETIKLRKAFFTKAVFELDESQKYSEGEIEGYLDFVIYTLKKIAESKGLRNVDALTICKELTPIIKSANKDDIALWHLGNISKQLKFTHFTELDKYKVFLDNELKETDKKGVLELHVKGFSDPYPLTMKMMDRRWMFGNLNRNTDEFIKFLINRVTLISKEKGNAVKLINELADLSRKLREAKEYKDFKEILKNSVFKQTLVKESDIDHAAIGRERQYQQFQALVLAQNIKKQLKVKNAKCLVIHHFYFKKNRKDLNAFLKAYKTGFGDSVAEIKAVPIKVYDENQEDDIDLITEELGDITADSFNKILKENKGYDIVISMVSLPFSLKEISKVEFFKLVEDKNGKLIKDPKKKYPLVGIYNGYIGNLEAYFERNLIHAMTIWKPNPTIDEKPVPDDIIKAFSKRYLVIRPDNLKMIKAEYPKLFPAFSR